MNFLCRIFGHNMGNFRFMGMVENVVIGEFARIKMSCLRCGETSDIGLKEYTDKSSTK